MQMPRLAVPRISLGDLAERSVLWYSLYTTLLFLVFLVVTFPHDVLVRRALNLIPADSGVTVDFDDARFAWHRGLELSNVRINSAASPAPILEFTRLWIRPVAADLVRGNWRSLGLRAEAYGGDGSGMLSVSNDISGIIQLDGMSLGRYALLRSYMDEGTVGGRISARLDFVASGRDITKAQGSGDILLSNGSLEAAKINGLTVPDLHFGESKLSLSLQGDRLELKEFSAKGKELNIEASGQVSLRDPIDDSMLNLRTLINAGEEAPESIKSLLSMLPKPAPGQQDLRITGPLVHPKFR